MNVLHSDDPFNPFADARFLHIFQLPDGLYPRNFGWGGSNDDFETGSGSFEGNDAFETMTQHFNVQVRELARDGCEFVESLNHHFWRFERHGVTLSVTIVRQTQMIVYFGLAAQRLDAALLYDARGQMLL